MVEGNHFELMSLTLLQAARRGEDKEAEEFVGMILQWAGTPGVPQQAVTSSLIQAMIAACANGHLTTMRIVGEHIQIKSAQAMHDEIVQLICKQGSVETLQWYAGRFQIKNITGKAFIKACESGKLNLVEWVVANLGITQKSMQAIDFTPFLKACEKGHLQIAKWLYTHFEMRPEDAKADGENTVKKAQEKGNRLVVDWLENL